MVLSFSSREEAVLTHVKVEALQTAIPETKVKISLHYIGPDAPSFGNSGLDQQSSRQKKDWSFSHATTWLHQFCKPLSTMNSVFHQF
jgi:hypothetical protein